MDKIVGKELPFTIQNFGTGDLVLTGLPDMVTLSGPDANYFMVTQQPLTGIIVPDGSTTFKIRTVKTTPPNVPVGWQRTINLTVTIPNSFPEEDPFVFTLQLTVKKM